MAQTITGITQTKILTELDTYNHTALATSMYMVSCAVSEVPPSGITITIKQNGSTKATMAAPAAAQQLTQLQIVLNCVATDIITVVLASSTASDTGKNSFKAILNIHQGSV